ncbi:MAG: PDZ domain-containing protein [Actinomycetota bacterium]
MRRRLPLALITFLVACNQPAPARSSLPPAASIIPEPQACSFLVGGGQGVNITQIIADSAATGILEEGDLLVGIDEESVANADTLRQVLGEKSVGDEVVVRVIRGGEEEALNIVLGANPDAPERPLLGVLVSTEYESVLATELEGQLDGGPLSRPVSIGTNLYLLDPATTTWTPFGVETPDGTWVVSGEAVLTLEQPGEPDSALVDSVSASRLVFDAGQWNGSQILGTLGSSVIVAASRPIEGQDNLVEVAVILVDFTVRVARWIWPITADIGVPVAAFPSPDMTRILLVGEDQETSALQHMIISNLGQPMVQPDRFDEAQGNVVLGWFDDQSVLVGTSGEGLRMMDATTGSLSPLDLPPALGTVTRIWPVGDGVHLLAESSNRLIRFDLAGRTEIRTLADHCVVDLVGDIGWGA